MELMIQFLLPKEEEQKLKHMYKSIDEDNSG